MPSQDPTATQTRRRRWTSSFNARWRRVRGSIRRTIQADRFGLDQRDEAAVLAEFETWLTRQLDDEVLDGTSLRNVRNGLHHTGPEIRDGYEAGLRRADQALRAADYEVPDTTPAQAVNQPVHRNEIERAYVRSYQDLQTTGADTRQAVMRELDELLSGTDDPSTDELVDSLNDRIDAVGQTRTSMLTHSYIVEGANRAALRRYQQAGVETVGIDPEVKWKTAQDERVCAECAALADDEYLIEDVFNGDAPMPVRSTHPRCRCFYRPT